MNNLLHKPSTYNNIEKIYDTHAANMYGCIYKIVQDKLQAEKILIDIFKDFYTFNPSNVQTITTPLWFIKHAMKSTFIYLKEINSNNEEFFSLRKNYFKTGK